MNERAPPAASSEASSSEASSSLASSSLASSSLASSSPASSRSSGASPGVVDPRPRRAALAGPWSSGRALAIAAVVFVAVFVATHVASFPGTLAHFRAVTGGQQILDLQPAASADEVWRRLDAMGPDGRAAYRRLARVVDVAFPLAGTAFLVVLAAFAARRARASRVVAAALLALPVAYLIADAAENLVVVRLLDAFPARLDDAASILGALTRAKRGAQTAAFVAPLVALLIARARTRRP